MNRPGYFFLVALICIATWFGSISIAASKNSNKNSAVSKAKTIFIAYTCNTWGQLQPCPS